MQIYNSIGFTAAHHILMLRQYHPCLAALCSRVYRCVHGPSWSWFAPRLRREIYAWLLLQPLHPLFESLGTFDPALRPPRSLFQAFCDATFSGFHHCSGDAPLMVSGPEHYWGWYFYYCFLCSHTPKLSGKSELISFSTGTRRLHRETLFVPVNNRLHNCTRCNFLFSDLSTV